MYLPIKILIKLQFNWYKRQVIELVGSHKYLMLFLTAILFPSIASFKYLMEKLSIIFWHKNLQLDTQLRFVFIYSAVALLWCHMQKTALQHKDSENYIHTLGIRKFDFFLSKIILLALSNLVIFAPFIVSIPKIYQHGMFYLIMLSAFLSYLITIQFCYLNFTKNSSFGFSNKRLRPLRFKMLQLLRLHFHVFKLQLIKRLVFCIFLIMVGSSLMENTLNQLQKNCLLFLLPASINLLIMNLVIFFKDKSHCVSAYLDSLPLTKKHIVLSWYLILLIVLSVAYFFFYLGFYYHMRANSLLLHTLLPLFMASLPIFMMQFALKRYGLLFSLLTLVIIGVLS
jgi:hypothetical protein